MWPALLLECITIDVAYHRAYRTLHWPRHLPGDFESWVLTRWAPCHVRVFNILISTVKSLLQRIAVWEHLQEVGVGSSTVL